jgi:MerR family transcriptional regulator/heat shock protein HspR
VRDVALLREIQRLSQEDGVNLAGVKRIIDLERLVAALQERLDETEAALHAAYGRIADLEATSPYGRADLVPAARHTTALVVWKPRQHP